MAAAVGDTAIPLRHLSNEKASQQRCGGSVPAAVTADGAGGGMHGNPNRLHLTAVYELASVQPGDGGFACIPGSLQFHCIFTAYRGPLTAPRCLALPFHFPSSAFSLPSTAPPLPSPCPTTAFP